MIMLVGPFIEDPQTMTNILKIDASARPMTVDAQGAEGSFSRDVAAHLIDRLTGQGGSVTTRDLVADPLPHISDATIKGYYTPPDAMTDDLWAATALSDKLIAELRAADILVLSVPIYNFSVPSALKAWIDQVVRIGHSFACEDGQFSGLIHGKRAYLVLAYGAGGYANGGPLAAYDFLKPYLTMVLAFIGISDVTIFEMEATTDPSAAPKARAATLQAIDAHFERQVA
ncbi:MAG: NAD(P)H-dependent oxidoreductase [Pseudomonadota bacterium]